MRAMGILSAFVVMFSWPGVASAWESEGLRLRGRMQTRWQVEESEGDWSNQFILRRARVDGRWQVLDWLRMDLEFEGSDGVELKDAYARIEPWSFLKLSVGQFKKPFSRLRLDSPWALVIPERGLLDDTVVRKTSHGGFGGRDLGAMLSGNFVAGLKMRYSLGVFNGDGAIDGRDEQHTDYVGRFQIRPIKGLLLAVNAAHKIIYLGDRHLTANLFGADLRWTLGPFRLQAEAAYGDNPNAGPGHRLVGGHLIFSWRWEVRPGWTLIPAAMAEVLDPDDAVDGYGGRLAGALNLDVGEHLRLVLSGEGAFGDLNAVDAHTGALSGLDAATRIFAQVNVMY